jgi:Adenylate and Guanylate cyclase catalytic domain
MYVNWPSCLVPSRLYLRDFCYVYQTVNKAARMESTGVRNRIHCSHTTATLLESAGKSWTKLRDDLVHAKGKGELQTYWIELLKQSNPSRVTGSTSSLNGDSCVGYRTSEAEDNDGVRAGLKANAKPSRCELDTGDKERRLVDWNTEVLCRLMKQVVVHNQIAGARGSASSHRHTLGAANVHARNRTIGTIVIDEVVEIIELPKSQAVSEQDVVDAGRNAALDSIVVEQVREYIQSIAALYPANDFHNFEHVRC